MMEAAAAAFGVEGGVPLSRTLNPERMRRARECRVPASQRLRRFEWCLERAVRFLTRDLPFLGKCQAGRARSRFVILQQAKMIPLVLCF